MQQLHRFGDSGAKSNKSTFCFSILFFILVERFGFRLPRHRQAAERCLQYVDGIPTYRISLKLNLYEILKLYSLNLGKLNNENSKSWTEIMQSLTARNLNILI